MYDILVDYFKSHRNHRVELDRNEILFHQEERISSMFLVESGCVELTRFQENGSSIILHRATNRTILAEASLYSNVYHCDAVAVLPSSLFRIPKSAFQKLLDKERALSKSWASYLAREVQISRYRMEILSRNTVSERLDGWMAWHDGELPAKGTWKTVAAQIAVSPEAFYREIARRKKR